MIPAAVPNAVGAPNRQPHRDTYPDQAPRAVLSVLLTDGTPWLERVDFDPIHRWTEQVAATAEHQVWLQTWLPGQASDLHDHRQHQGAFIVLRGTLSEFVITPTLGHERHIWRPGVIRSYGAGHVHRLGNDHGPTAISLHVLAIPMALSH